MKERPILFSGPMVRAILDGRKSQTRRVVNVEKWKSGKWARDFVFCDDPNLYRAGDFNWVAGLSGQSEDRIDKGQHLSIPFRHRDDPARPWEECGRARIHCPHGWPGMMGEPADQLWVKETWKPDPAWGYPERTKPSDIKPGTNILYRATLDTDHPKATWQKWRPSIFMPFWASRIILEVTAVRVERLQDISADDARAEGIPVVKGTGMIEGEDCYLMTTNSGYMRGSAGAIAAYEDLWESINGPGSWDANPWVWVIEFKRITPTSEEGEG